jgi:hypothetical protein
MQLKPFGERLGVSFTAETRVRSPLAAQYVLFYARLAFCRAKTS